MRSLPSVVLASLLALVAPVLVTGAHAEPATPAPPTERVSAVADPDREPDREPQTSDGVVGETAPPRTAAQRQRRDVSAVRKVNIVPGVDVHVWDETTDRGPNRLHLMTVKWQTPGLRVDYANPGRVASTAPVTTMLRAGASTGAVAGVNGDFFDIGGSGAPRGVGRDLERGLLNGRLAGWNGAFSFTRSGWPTVGLLATQNRVRYYPDLEVGALNAPVVDPDSIGAYTSAWGDASGTAWTGGQRTGVRVVQVYRHRVTHVSSRLPQGHEFRGTLLIGRGEGARALGRLRVGALTDVISTATGDPRMAIGGNRFLIRRGIIQPTDDSEMHPRTAVGVDRDTKTLLLLVVDGRQRHSRGYTMVELAEKLADLGADDALNLDGGGSTTMVARRAGTLRVMNSPSDGRSRPVANAIEIRYQRPR